jgi:hypothetical protein
MLNTPAVACSQQFWAILIQYLIDRTLLEVMILTPVDGEVDNCRLEILADISGLRRKTA